MTGVILAGGKSSRMGEDKAFLQLGSRTMIEELISRLSERFAKLIIIANTIEKYRKFDLEVFSDIIPEKGPLGGIYTALARSDTFYNFIFACDAPFVDQGLIAQMAGERDGADIVVPRHNGRLEPLHAIYSKNCLGPIERRLRRGDLKIADLFCDVDTKVVELQVPRMGVSSKSAFANINTKEEYHLLIKE